MSGLLSGFIAAWLAIAPLPLVKTVPHSRWLARCSAVPVSTSDGLTVVAAHRPGAYVWLLGMVVNNRLYVGTLTAYRIGGSRSLGGA